jgi:mannitol-specific phosphotransferase system IIBC component
VKNPWLVYSLLRLGMFFALFFTLFALDFNPFFAAIIAAAISFAVSLLLLDRQRDALSQSVAKKLVRDQSGKYDDKQGEIEDELLDSKEVDQVDPRSDQSPKP